MKTFTISNLLLVVTIIGLLTVLILDRLPPAPIEFSHSVASQSPNIKIYSYPDERRAEITVAGDNLRPMWKSTEYNPPLSARQAIALAMTKRKEIVNDPPNGQWVLKEAAITPFDANNGIWFWLITFEEQTNGITTGMIPHLKLAILMDGSVVEPELIQKNQISAGEGVIIGN